ncbi:GNAT family N-acetyltransferase [Actinoplanes teichomyceticus]|uniref:[SSU ribosomal protein S5P]-alanine acetyltransferase n=1 Tax=Actinoplanes teichomyceticus TaxID=1867 RepID=A0A561WNM1_ACTTI|nr:GNAT family protein [Actinoplanes teichomyceticus]TWG25466.1 [SSU ribosomal protein S5P]-alanine acetyltransferase [Actinoplanes teichomyceticus]GIF10535.1 ribosomal-protein-alanine N-acetyltransferase [Actinoplanes teichomyceticus]
MSVAIRPLTLDDVPALTAVLRASREHLAPWEPSREESYYTEREQRRIVADTLRAGGSLPHVILDDGALAGRVNLNNIVRGPFQSASLGYWVAAGRGGRGLATGAVAAVLRMAFTEYGLHRVEAATLLHNVRSQRVLAKNGFRRIGTAPRYLNIAGAWQDHHLFQIVAENWVEGRAAGR